MKCRYCDGTGTSNTCVNGTFKPCAACDGTGEEIPDDEVMYITDINFDRITASEEALAEFISDIVYECREGNRYEELEGCSVCNLHWCSKQDV